MVTMGVFPFQGKTHMVEPGIEPGTSWLVVRNSEHQATRLVTVCNKLGALQSVFVDVTTNNHCPKQHTHVSITKMRRFPVRYGLSVQTGLLLKQIASFLD